MNSQCLVAVVDDDISIRDSMEDFLKSYGYDCRSFSSAEEFQNFAQKSEVGCIILDVNMTGLSGLQLQKQLNNSARKTPIIFVTSCTNDRVRSAALKDGAVAYLNKPIQIDTLIKYLDVVSLR